MATGSCISNLDCFPPRACRVSIYPEMSTNEDGEEECMFVFISKDIIPPRWLSAAWDSGTGARFGEWTLVMPIGVEEFLAEMRDQGWYVTHRVDVTEHWTDVFFTTDPDHKRKRMQKLSARLRARRPARQDSIHAPVHYVAPFFNPREEPTLENGAWG